MCGTITLMPRVQSFIQLGMMTESGGGRRGWLQGSENVSNATELYAEGG